MSSRWAKLGEVRAASGLPRERGRENCPRPRSGLSKGETGLGLGLDLELVGLCCGLSLGELSLAYPGAGLGGRSGCAVAEEAEMGPPLVWYAFELLLEVRLESVELDQRSRWGRGSTEKCSEGSTAPLFRREWACLPVPTVRRAESSEVSPGLWGVSGRMEPRVSVREELRDATRLTVETEEPETEFEREEEYRCLVGWCWRKEAMEALFGPGSSEGAAGERAAPWECSVVAMPQRRLRRTDAPRQCLIPGAVMRQRRARARIWIRTGRPGWAGKGPRVVWDRAAAAANGSDAERRRGATADAPGRGFSRAAKPRERVPFCCCGATVRSRMSQTVNNGPFRQAGHCSSRAFGWVSRASNGGGAEHQRDSGGEMCGRWRWIAANGKAAVPALPPSSVAPLSRDNALFAGRARG